MERKYIVYNNTSDCVVGWFDSREEAEQCIARETGDVDLIHAFTGSPDLEEEICAT